MRTALVALIAFMPTAGEGALGSLDYPPEDRRDLARKSARNPPSFSDPERDAVAKRLFGTLKQKLSALTPASAPESVSTDAPLSVEAVAADAAAAAASDRTATPSEKDDEAEVSSGGGNINGRCCEAGEPCSSMRLKPSDADTDTPQPSRMRREESRDVVDSILLYLIYAVAALLVALVVKKSPFFS